MNEITALKNAITVLEEKCLYSSAKWLYEFIVHYQQRKNDYPSVETNFFQRYPSNLTATYRKARLLFGTHSFAQAASTIEQVDFFEKNQSFLFLWGYSKYMDYQEQMIYNYYETRNGDVFSPYPHIPEENLAFIRSRIDESSCDAFLNYLLGLCYKNSNRSKALRCFVNAAKEFPQFWGVWTELMHMITNRSQLMYLLNGTSHSIFRDLFWFCFTNHQCDTTFPLEKQDLLTACLPSWWFQNYQVAHYWYLQGEYQKAIELLTACPLEKDYHEEIGVLLASIYFETKNEEGLVLLSSTVSRLYPKALSTYFIAGCVHHLKHELDTAEKYYCLLLETLPQSYLTWSMLGQVYVEKGECSLAIQCFGKGKTIHPTDYRFYYHLGLVYELLHNLSSSIVHYKKACSLRPYDPHLRVALGDVYLAIGEKQAAIDSYLVAESMNEREGEADRKLGQLYEDQGDEESKTKAAYFYRRYLKKRKDNVCDEESYYPALFLCRYYKERGEMDLFHRMCQMLVVANSENVQKEARKMLDDVV